MKRIVLAAVVGLAAALIISTASADTLKAGIYLSTLSCGSGSCEVTQIEFTKGGVVQDTWTPQAGVPFKCTASGEAKAYQVPTHDFDDLAITYKCGTDPAGVLYIAPGQLEAGEAYTLTCPSSAVTSTPGPTPDSGDATITIKSSSPVGGIAEVAGAEASALGATDSDGSSTATYAVIAVVAGVALLGAGGWYARRRWLS